MSTAPVRNESTTRDRSRLAWLSIGIVLATVAVYAQIGGHGFVYYDDPGYITRNAVVNNGLGLEAIGTAFSESIMSNWHPLTWISHMLDVELFGLEPGGHHLMSLALHALNAVLLLLALHALTGSVWRAALVAALFALHPLRAESVAWASERKDVLSGTFWMLVMLAHAGFAQRPTRGRRILVMVLLALGLMAKPMLVTLPVVLLLLDVWPLERTGQQSFRELLIEKAPLAAIAVAAAVVTIGAQQEGGSVASTEVIALGDRLLHAPLAIARYLANTVWPAELTFFYPHPAQVERTYALPAVLSLVGVVAVTVLVFRYRRSRPWLALGWAWFLVTLAPVLGILQVGEQALADRYTYLPGIGLAIALAWEACALVQRRRALQPIVCATCLAALLGLSVRAHAQVGTWKDDPTLLRHALRVTENNYVALSLLGSYELDAGRYEAAREHLEQALRIEPRHSDAIYNLGTVHLHMGHFELAEARLRETLHYRPDSSNTHNNLGVVLSNLGRIDEALAYLEQAVACDAENEAARGNLAAVRAMRKRAGVQGSGN